jgi:hypothetical protein
MNLDSMVEFLVSAKARPLSDRCIFGQLRLRLLYLERPPFTFLLGGFDSVLPVKPADLQILVPDNL